MSSSPHQHTNRHTHKTNTRPCIMGNQMTKETPVDNTTKTNEPKEYGPEPYFTNPAAHLRQPNEIPQLRQPAVTADDWEEVDGEWVIVNTPQPADVSEELDGEWVIVETPQGETKVRAENPPARMKRSFTVPVPCNTCGEPFQYQVHTQSIDCVSCSIDKEQRDKEQRQKDYNAFMHPSGSPGTPLSVYDDIDSPLSEDSDLWRGVVSYEQLVQLDKVRDFDEELLDKSSNALNIERQLTMARVPDPPVKSWAAVLNTGPKKFRNPIQEAKDAAKAAKAEESIRRREEEEKADAAYRKQMEHRRIHTESYQRMRKKSEERTNKRRNAVRQINEMEDHEDFWGVGHENRLNLGERYGDDREYRTKWENLEEQMWDSN